MNKYNEWLHLTCKWATVGLDKAEEYQTFDRLGAELNKQCSCEEDTCTCDGLGLILTNEEKNILDFIEQCKQ